MSSGVVPNNLKIANVIPILKTGDSREPANYRPISLLSTLSKVLEKLVNVRFVKYINNNNLLAGNQFGFRSGRSTEDAVTNLVNFVTDKIDEGQKCMGVFLDLAKAFDTVSRPILLKKLELLGVRGLALDWFQSYLFERKQRICIGDHTSDYTEIGFGVPQGSILGPTLFLVYINDLCALELPNARIFTFADDTAVIFHAKTWSQVAFVAQEGLENINNWLYNNLLTINTGKTKYVVFRVTERSAPERPLYIKLHNCKITISNGPSCQCAQLEQVQSVKYLGVIIDQRLSWAAHIDTVRKRLRKLIHIFKKLSSVAYMELLRLVYLSLCQSVLNYCVVVWGGANKTNLISLERVQRAILKIALKKPWRYPTDSLYADCRLARVRQLYIASTILRFHKNAKNLARVSHRTLKWDRPRVRLSFARRSFEFMGPYLYSKLYTANNNILNMNRSACRKSVYEWLESRDYNRTEELLQFGV